MSNLEKKSKKLLMVEAIMELHPSFGTEKGWSEYTGGMADTGQWFMQKLMTQTEKNLREFYVSATVKQREEEKTYSVQGKILFHLTMKTGGYDLKVENDMLTQFTCFGLTRECLWNVIEKNNERMEAELALPPNKRTITKTQADNLSKIHNWLTQMMYEMSPHVLEKIKEKEVSKKIKTVSKFEVVKR